MGIDPIFDVESNLQSQTRNDQFQDSEEVSWVRMDINGTTLEANQL